MGLPSSRYFVWAERLRFRDGAVRGALAMQLAVQPSTRPAAAGEVGAGEEVQRADDPRELERLTNQNGFMGFEYAGG